MGLGSLDGRLQSDRYPDVYIAYGGINFEDSNQLFRGSTTGIFENITADAGDAGLGDLNSAVVVRADFDLDGDQT